MTLRLRQTYTLLILCILGFTSSFVNAQTANPIAEELRVTLDKEFEEIFERYNLQGLAAGVVFEDGSVWDAAKGRHGNDGLMSPEMLYEIGSNTKTYTAAIILQMAAEGKLSLSDSIGQHLGYLDTSKFIDMGITIKQMLNHTSGLYSYTDNPDFANDVNGDLVNKKIMPGQVLENYMDESRFEAGTDWNYSNTNYLLLGLIVEAVDGKPFEESLRQRIFEPFELEHSYLDIFEQYSEPRSGTWLPSGFYLSDPLRGFMSSAWAAGGVVSTTEDLAKWAKLLYTNKILNEAWTDSMKTLTEVDGEKYPYGLGMFYRKFQGNELFGHGGTTLQHSTMEYSPNGDFALVMVINEQARGAISTPLQNAMLNVIWNALIELGSDEPRSEAVGIYPNPAQNRVRVQLPNSETSATLVLRDLQGREVTAQSINATGWVDLEDINRGLYLAEVRNGEGQFLSATRLMIQ